MRRVGLLLLGWVVCASGAWAADAEADDPYDFQVIVRVAPHRLLTPTFRRQLRADLKDSLQAAFGSLARVQVLDADALPGDVWLAPAALDGHSALGPTKRHFVEVSFADGRYAVQARQLDGSTGLASPVVRQAHTADRAFVARLITRFIDQDFGAVGTVVGKEGERVRLRFRGGAVPTADLARWAPAGSVFALVRVEGEPPRGRPLEAAYLVSLAEPRDGQCECQLYSRFLDTMKRDPLADWQHVTFRALRLGTTSGPLRLRILDKNDLPVSGVQVRVSAEGFKPTDPVRDQGAVRDGAFDTAHAYDRIAFVQVAGGERTLAQVPVPVIDDRVTVIRRIDQGANGEARQQLELDARNARQRLQDIFHGLREMNRRLGTMAKASQNREALALVKNGLDVLDSELSALTAELTRLRNQSGPVGASVGPTLDQCDVYLREIRKRRTTLLQNQDDLEKAINAETSPEAQEKKDTYLGLLRRAEAQREEAEFEEAMKTYEEILQQFGERPEVRKRLDDLKEAWKLKGEEHRKARAFAYGGWAGVKTFEDVRTNLPRAREAFDTCKAVGDRLTALKLTLVASTTATDIVAKKVEELENSQADEDKLVLKQVQQVADELQTLIKDLSTFVRPESDKKGD